jgi:hypothetical protein
VADMAAALAATTVRIAGMREVGEEVEVEVERRRQEGEEGGEERPKEMKMEKRTVKRMEEIREKLARVVVEWRDVLDAEFAAKWPETVVHDRWVTTTWNNRRPPPGWTEIEEADAQAAVKAEEETAAEPVKKEAGKVVL